MSCTTGAVYGLFPEQGNLVKFVGFQEWNQKVKISERSKSLVIKAVTISIATQADCPPTLCQSLNTGMQLLRSSQQSLLPGPNKKV